MAPRKAKAKGAPAPPPSRVAAIDAVIAAIDKKYPRGVRRLDAGFYEEVQLVVSTGLPSLDAALGVGGIPLNKIVCFEGPESSGKTTLSKQVAVRAQLQGVVPIFWDMEQSGVMDFDTSLGLDLKDALGDQPDTMEEVVDKTVIGLTVLAKLKTPGLVIWDSVAASPLADELERALDEEGRMAERAAFLSKALRNKLLPLLKLGPVGIVIVNQIRERIGAPPYAKQTYATGGRALRHYSHVKIEMTPMGMVKRGDEIIGIKTRAKVVKNKLAPPYREAELEIHFNPARVVEAGRPVRQPMKPRE